MCCCHFAVQTNPLGEKSSSSCISRNWFYRLFICFPLFSLQFKYEEFLNCCRFEPLSSVVGGDGSVHCTTTTARNEPWLTWRHYDDAHLDYHNRRWSSFLKSLNNIVWPILFGSSPPLFSAKKWLKIVQKGEAQWLENWHCDFCLNVCDISHTSYVVAPIVTEEMSLPEPGVTGWEAQWRLSPFLP